MPNQQDPSMDLIMRLAQSDAGKQLIAMFRSQSGDALNPALEQARAGNYGPLQASIQQFMATPQAQALLKKLGR